jgi:hypothetical protein
MKPINLLVTGHIKARLALDEASLQQRMTDILNLFKQAQLGEQYFEILTGVVDGVDSAAIASAIALDMPVKVMAPQANDLEQFAKDQPQLAPQLKSQLCFYEGAELTESETKQLKAIRDREALHFADMVLVAWDGADTLEGGTVAITISALQNKIPVVWLNTKENLSIHIVDPSKATDEWHARMHLPLKSMMEVKAVFKQVEASALSDYLQSFEALLDEQEPISAVKRTFAGVWHKLPTWLMSYRWSALKSLLHKPSSLNPFTQPKAWEGEERGASDFYDTTDLNQTFSIYDENATHFSNRHRDSVFLLYFLSALAVFSAVAGSIYLWVAKGSHAWGWIEVVAISTIVALLTVATKRHWHQKWVRYRFIAEQTRYAKVSLVMFHLPKTLARGVGFLSPVTPSARRPHKEPVLIVKRALVHLGLPVSPEEPYFVTSHQMTGKAQLLKRLIDDQLGYHKRNATKLHNFHHRMHKISLGLFMMTVVAVISHFFVHASWLLIMTAAFPALAAALHGILTKLELSKIHNQSHHLVKNLETLSAVLQKDLEQQRFERNGFADYVYLRRLYEQATVLMSQESEQWQDLISSQTPELPG